MLQNYLAPDASNTWGAVDWFYRWGLDGSKKSSVPNGLASGYGFSQVGESLNN